VVVTTLECSAPPPLRPYRLCVVFFQDDIHSGGAKHVELSQSLKSGHRRSVWGSGTRGRYCYTPAR